LTVNTEPPLTNFAEATSVAGDPGRVSALFRRHFHKGRGGRAKLAISTSLIARIVTALISFAIMPITIRYLGNEGYGLMVTISSVVGWLQFSNMGIGLGLQNALTEETAKGDRTVQRELVSTAVVALAAIGVGLLVVGAAVYSLIDWLKIFPPSTERFAYEIPWCVAIVFFGFVSTVVLGFVGPIYAARQELHLGSIQSVCSSAIGMLGTLFVVHNRLGLTGIVAVTVGATGLVQWAFALWTLYWRRIPELRPSLKFFTQSAWKRLFHSGLQFFLLQICNIVFFQLDAMLINHFLSADRVTPYAVAQKVFLQVGGLLGMVTGSLWAAYGNAKAQRDFVWIRSTHGKIVRLFCFFYGALSFGMVLAGKHILSWWVGVAAAPSVTLLFAVAFYFCLRDWTALYAMLLNGLNVIREQIPALIVTSLLALLFEIYLIKRFGTVGLAIGGGLGFLLAGGWYLPYVADRAIKKVAPVRLG
jgi:O-antigen/teichoic acid export membrane protein